MTFPPDSPFSALPRVFGRDAYEHVSQLRVCVVGIGGVGSWSVEALARTGIGHVTMIDHDDIAASNINRQIHALTTTVGESKVELMRDRIAGINESCEVVAIDDLLVDKNMSAYLDNRFDVVIDAIDSVRFKASMINFCKRNHIPIITTGGAGGRINPLQVEVADLSLTWNDALAASVRHRLRSHHGYTQNPKRRFGVECVFSSEQPVYPDESGGLTHARPGSAGVRLDCEQGYGSISMVTGTFGLVAAARAVKKALHQRAKAKK